MTKYQSAVAFVFTERIYISIVVIELVDIIGTTAAMGDMFTSLVLYFDFHY